MCQLRRTTRQPADSHGRHSTSYSDAGSAVSRRAMAKDKNVSGGPLELRVPGLGAYVEDGGIVDIPDYQPGHSHADPSEDCDQPGLHIVVPVDPPAKWQAVTDSKPKARAGKADG